MSPRRIALVGTDTAVGKTTLACSLLAQAAALGVRVLPFKPAQSSAPDDPHTDAERMLDALASSTREGDPLHSLALAELCPLRYAAPVAPGIADDPRRFLGPTTPDDAPLAACSAALARTIDRTRPDLVVVELAGGLWVPMPGGTWQPQWIRALATDVLLVGRAGLGTINAALLTIDALRELELAPLAFVTCETSAPDPSCRDNAAVIACARDLPHLGTLPHDRPAPSLLTPLLELLRR